MRRFLQLLIAVSISIISQAQTLPGINYQALVRNASGNPMVSQTFQMQVSILFGSETGEAVYSENHTAQTNAFGQINLSIGEGEATQGVFSAINWGSGTYYLKTAVDFEGSGAFQEIETVRFYSVPYSLISGGMPALSSAERDAISNPGVGMQIYNTQRYCIEFYTPAGWLSTTPAGTILPFAGPTDQIPEGYLLCNGALVDISAYPELHAKIGNAWGGASTQFRLPDTRGMFLRGVANGSANDPDRASRTASATGGNTGDNVGSKQLNATGSHNHSVNALTTDTMGAHRHAVNSDWSGSAGTEYRRLDASSADGNSYQTVWAGYNIMSSAGNHSHTVPQHNTNNKGGNETRPINVYVNYIIKY